MKHIITYKDLLVQIEDKENHLLIANGFNYGLGVNTGYGAIFDQMIKNNIIYEDARVLFEESNCDLEIFIGKLTQQVDAKNKFLAKYIANNVKLDFMRATHEIVKSQIKNIYAEKNEGVFLLLRNFTNYFTLNYDSFLYLFLLKYSNIENENNNAIAFIPTLEFIEHDLNTQENNIYTEIKSARNTGKLKISINENQVEKDLNKLPKTHFINEIKTYSKANRKGWTEKDIKKVVSILLKEELSNQLLNEVNDGSRQLRLFSNDFEYIFENPETQNLFFLHGAFHIYKEGKKHKKITQQTDKALYDRLEEILNKDGKDIVCVFQRENKIAAIKNDNYLINCLNRLNQISGNLVIIGSSLAENDNHIFDNINKSNIETIYISAIKKEINDKYMTAKQIFPNKDIYMFEAETISYEMPETN